MWIQRGDWISVLVAVADPCVGSCRVSQHNRKVSVNTVGEIVGL